MSSPSETNLLYALRNRPPRHRRKRVSEYVWRLSCWSSANVEVALNSTHQLVVYILEINPWVMYVSLSLLTTEQMSLPLRLIGNAFPNGGAPASICGWIVESVLRSESSLAYKHYRYNLSYNLQPHHRPTSFLAGCRKRVSEWGWSTFTFHYMCKIGRYFYTILLYIILKIRPPDTDCHVILAFLQNQIRLPSNSSETRFRQWIPKNDHSISISW